MFKLFSLAVLFLVSPSALAGNALPSAVTIALEKAGIAPDAISVIVTPLTGDSAVLAIDAERSRSPASTMKLLTTLVALEELGPNFRWKTQLLSSADLNKDVLQGDLILRGGGDPNLTWDKLALMLRSLRLQGVRKIAGDIVLDRSYYRPSRPDLETGAFDENINAYYNVVPDPLLINSNITAFEIDSTANKLRVTSSPPLADVNIVNKLATNNASCANWDTSWNAPTAEVGKNKTLTITLSGSFPRHCKITTYLNLVDRNTYLEHLMRAIWQELGGVWNGEVKDSGVIDNNAPSTARVLVERPSETLADTVKIVNKFSDNGMARMLYLTLGAESADAKNYPQLAQAAQARVLAWLDRHQINRTGLLIDNGSGLSRTEQISAQQLAAILSAGARSTWAPEYLSSLPIAALDGSMRRRLKGNIAEGQARIKTGTLKNVVAIAGYVRDINNVPWITVAIINSEQASKGRPVLDEVIAWVAAGRPMP